MYNSLFVAFDKFKVTEVKFKKYRSYEKKAGNKTNKTRKFKSRSEIGDGKSYYHC